MTATAPLSPTDGRARGFSLTSWNIHRGRGQDGQVDPARTLSVLEREVWQAGGDALILQEADAEARPQAGVLEVAEVERITGLRHVHGARATRLTDESHGFLGVVVYLREGIAVEDMRLLDLPGVCPRGAVVLDLSVGGQAVTLAATHLSLSQGLRAVQMRTLRQHLGRFAERPLILCGDLNEWRPWGGFALSRRVLGREMRGPALPSFPVRRPVLPLDRVLVSAPLSVAHAEVRNGPGIRVASDHRPLRAEVRFG